MGWIQWMIIATFLVRLSGSGWFCKKYIKGVGNWLVAGRGCGKYLGATAGEAASYGAISFIGMLPSDRIDVGSGFYNFQLSGN